MKMTILALAMLLCARQLQASLGENELQIVARYGKVLGSFVPEAGRYSTEEFEYGNYHVSVTYLDGQSGKEVFTRKDKKPLDAGQIQALLDANALGSKWEKKKDAAEATLWALNSRKAFAAYYKTLNSLSIKTDDMLAFELAGIQAITQQQAAKASQTPAKDKMP